MYALFFFNDTATTEIYTLSLHDALPIFDVRLVVPDQMLRVPVQQLEVVGCEEKSRPGEAEPADILLDRLDRKSTRLNSSHSQISYAVFCLKKKKNTVAVKHT